MSQSTKSSGRSTDGKSRSRLVDAGVIAAIIGAVSALAVAVVEKWPMKDSPPPASTASPGNVQSPGPVSTLPARPPADARTAVVSYTENKGLSTFVGPGDTFGRGSPANLPEGTVIAVVCQERHGPIVYDPTGDNRRYRYRWPVWDRLTNGLWVSDLYTDLPKNPGDTPPDGVSRCD